MKALTTAGLTKLIQLIKSNFISTSDTVTTNTVTLATVATSGSYNDLSNKPTIPTVDQTFDGTSANAQSGVAIAGAKFVQNMTTVSNSINIGGDASSYSFCTNIGVFSQVGNVSCTALGYNTNASGVSSICIGNNASASASSAIQIGKGTNSTANTLQVGFSYANTNYQLLDGTTGLIPDARISTNIARTSQIPSVTVDQTYDGTSTNAQSGVAIAGAGFLQNAATGSNSIAILGTSSYNYATALGYNANANDTSAVAIGSSSFANYQQATAVGTSAQATAAGTVAIGGSATATVSQANAFGYLSEASASGATALGYEAKATASGALQIGTGTNNTANSLQVSSYTLLDTSTGIIPTARLGTNVDGQWVDIDQSIISSATSLNGSTDLTYRVDLPNDGHKYEVMLRGSGYTNSTAGNDLWIVVSGNQDSMTRYMCRARAGTAGTFAGIGTVICTMSYVASSAKNLTLSRSTSWNGSCTELRAIAYRRIGTNT